MLPYIPPDFSLCSGGWVLVEPMECEQKDLNQRNQRVGRKKKRKKKRERERDILGTSLAVGWLRLPSNAEGASSIPGPGTKIPCVAWPQDEKK